jgi:hypothetical protein
MYTDNNNGCFPTRGLTTGRWIDALYDYYSKIEKMRVCPAARKYAVEYPPGGSLGGANSAYGNKFTSWGKLSNDNGRPAGTYGSYGINEWVQVPGEGLTYVTSFADFWKTPNVKGAAHIPLFLDCRFFGGWPLNSNVPPNPENNQDLTDGQGGQAMKRFCINRHQGAINGVFLDYSIRKIGLKQLWTLKWHRTFNTCGTWTKCGGADAAKWNTAAPWMSNFPLY